MPFTPNFYVDITDTWAQKEEAMQAYETGNGIVSPEKIEYFRNDAENKGRQNGVKMAEGFQIIKWLAP